MVRTSNRFVDTIAGGWNLGLICELQSGPHFGVTEASNRLNTFSSIQRAHLVGDPTLPADRPRSQLVTQYFSTNAFAFPGDGVLGNTPRAFLEGPGLANFDVSLLKSFAISEHKSFELRGEFFNAFNRPNFGLPAASRGAANFGAIAGSRDGRIVQIGLRFIY